MKLSLVEKMMITIERSGYYQTDNGESFLVTQGVVGNTLIAGKQILFRLFVDQTVLPLVDYVVVTDRQPKYVDWHYRFKGVFRNSGGIDRRYRVPAPLAF
jgi:hypothetical protein